MNSIGSQSDSAKLIGLDWGTTSLRAYLLADLGRTLQARTLPLGVMRVQERETHALGKSQAFEIALEEACGDWIRGTPSRPVLATGMVGSNQGWKETPYLYTPIDISGLADHLTQIMHSRGWLIHVVPGLLHAGKLPDLMRGEETQVLGALPSSDSLEYGQDLLFGLPGTHSKWVYVSCGCVHRFTTFMTGELYAALCQHTILGKMLRNGSPDLDAFDRGVRVAVCEEGKLGVLSNIFSVRTLGITGLLSPDAQAEYLSGVLIGHEISAVCGVLVPQGTGAAKPLKSIILVGDDNLCTRYARALKIYGYEDVGIVSDAVQRGLWRIAVRASLVNTV